MIFASSVTKSRCSKCHRYNVKNHSNSSFEANENGSKTRDFSCITMDTKKRRCFLHKTNQLQNHKLRQKRLALNYDNSISSDVFFFDKDITRNFQCVTFAVIKNRNRVILTARAFKKSRFDKRNYRLAYKNAAFCTFKEYQINLLFIVIHVLEISVSKRVFLFIKNERNIAFIPRNFRQK